MAMIKIDLTALPELTNEVYYPLYKNKSRYLVLYGGAGSGKSVFAAQKILVRCLTEKPHRFLVVRKVARTLRFSVFSLFQDMIAQWQLTPLFKINKSDMTITCVNGNQIIFAGLDDVEKLKSIAGITGIWIEEASELEQKDFQQLDLRLRGSTKHYKQIILSFNPISALHWLKKVFFDFKKENATIVKSTYKDNKFIDPEYVKVLEDLKNQDATYYKIYALGEWGVLGNLVYTNYVIEDIPTDENHYSSIYYGLDFGYNDPSALVKIGWKDNEIYILDEIYERHLTNTELIKECQNRVNKRFLIIADSAEPDRIEEFKKAGFRIQPCTKGKDSVRFGIDWIKRHKIHIHPSCVNTIKEIQTYKYREDKDGNVLDEPVDVNNHAMDALRYATEALRNERPSSPEALLLVRGMRVYG